MRQCTFLLLQYLKIINILECISCNVFFFVILVLFLDNKLLKLVIFCNSICVVFVMKGMNVLCNIIFGNMLQLKIFLETYLFRILPLSNQENKYKLLPCIDHDHYSLDEYIRFQPHHIRVLSIHRRSGNDLHHIPHGHYIVTDTRLKI